MFLFQRPGSLHRTRARVRAPAPRSAGGPPPFELSPACSSSWSASVPRRQCAPRACPAPAPCSSCAAACSRGHQSRGRQYSQHEPMPRRGSNLSLSRSTQTLRHTDAARGAAGLRRCTGANGRAAASCASLLSVGHQYSHALHLNLDRAKSRCSRIDQRNNRNQIRRAEPRKKNPPGLEG